MAEMFCGFRSRKLYYFVIFQNVFLEFIKILKIEYNMVQI